MSNIFDIDTEDLINNAKYWKKTAPFDIKRTTAIVLNTLAFEAKKQMFNIAQEEMTIRAKGFIRSSIRVQKTKATIPLHLQKAVAGNIIDRPRYTGWIEQQHGTKNKQTHTFNKLGRVGKRGKVRQKFRFKPDTVFPTPEDIGTMSAGWQRTHAFLDRLRRDNKFRQPFMIKKSDSSKGLRSGLYIMYKRKRNNIRMIASFGSKQPKRVDIIDKTELKVFAKIDIQRLFMDTYKKLIVRKQVRKIMKGSK